MKSYITQMTHSELSDDVKASLNSLIEDKINDPDPYIWHLPPNLALPDGPPAHRRMPRKVHRWPLEELQRWKRALDKGEVKLLTKQDDMKSEKTVRREKKERVRLESKRLGVQKNKKEDMKVEVIVDTGFPRSKYQVVDESGAEVEGFEVPKTKKSALKNEDGVRPIVANSKIRAASAKLQADPTSFDLLSIPQQHGVKSYDFDVPSQQEYNFEDFFDEQAHIPLTAQNPTKHNSPAPPHIRLERESLKQEFRQKIAQIFGTSDPGSSHQILKEEDWEQQVVELRRRLERHEVDLRGELDVLRTVCKELHDAFYKQRGGRPLPFSDSKVSEAIEFLRGVFADVLFYGAGLAVEDALEVVKRRYQEHLARKEGEQNKEICDCAKTFDEECSRLREQYQDALTKMEDAVKGATARFIRKTTGGSETDEASPTKGGESKRRRKRAEIKSLQGQILGLQRQVDQNTKTAEEISMKEDIVQGQLRQIQRQEERIEEQAIEIESLLSQLTKKKNPLSGGKDVPHGAEKSPYFSSPTVAANGKTPQTSKSNKSAPPRQETPIHPPKLVHMQGKPYLSAGSTHNPSSTTAATNALLRRRKKSKGVKTPGPDSIVMPVGLPNDLELKRKRNDQELYAGGGSKSKRSKKDRKKKARHDY